MVTQPKQTGLIFFWSAITILLALPICITLFLTQDFYCKQQHKIATLKQQCTSEQKPFLHITDGVLRHIDTTHRYELLVHAQKTDVLRNSSCTVCTNVQATIFDKKRHEIQITADRGIITQDEKKVYFPTLVQMRSDENLFEGTQITYYFDRHEFFSDQPFTLKNSLVTTQATRGTVNIKTGQANLQGGIVTTITPHDTQQPQ